MMNCSKCGSKITDDDVFCPECGHKIDNEKVETVEKPPKKEKHNSSEQRKIHLPKNTTIIGNVILAVISIAAIAMVVFAVPVSYAVQESYFEKEPYSATETYSESESYQDQECQRIAPQFNTDYNYTMSTEFENQIVKVSCTVTNYADEAITFTYMFNSYNGENIFDSYGPIKITIVSGNAQTVTSDMLTLDKSVGSRPGAGCSIGANPIERCKTLTKWRDVPKTRTVTKYMDAYKEKTVTKKTTLFDIWTGNAK